MLHPKPQSLGTWYVSFGPLLAADVERKGPLCIADLVVCGLSPFLILGDICVVIYCRA